MLFSRLIKRGTRLALALIIGLATVGSLPAPAQAQSPVVNLELGGEGATSWDIGNIKPGDSGTKTVTLHNAGHDNGFVTIWISDIVSSDGTNPESETGDTTELGELADHLVLNLSCNGLSANLSLPATIDNFPQSASSSDYIRISPLKAGETVTLVWEWEFPETGEPQNDAQGDSLSFTINYLLEELPSDGGGGGEGGDVCHCKVDILGEITTLRMTRSDSRLIESYIFADPDNRYFLELKRGTRLICHCGCPACGTRAPTRVVMSLAEELLPVPDGVAIVGPVYKFTGYTRGSVRCDWVTLDPPITIILSYDSDELPEACSSLAIACYDDNQGDWIDLPPCIDHEAENCKVTGLVSHFTQLAILARSASSSPSPSPSPLSVHFVASDLNIILSQERIWEPITFMTRIGASVTICANIANDGGQEGTYIVELKIDGEIVDTKEVTLGTGQNQQVSFTLFGVDYGQHEVEVAGLSSEFTVWRTINWWLIIGIIVAIALITWGAIWDRRRKKAILNEQPSP